MVRILVSLILMIGLVGCNARATTLDCSQIEALLPEESMMGAGLEEIRERVANLDGVSEGNIQVYDYPTSKISTVMNWQHEGNDYSASFTQERLRRVLVTPRSGSVTLGAVLDCLREPAYYTFTLDQHAESWRYDLTLWYPELRLIVGTTRFQNTPAPLMPERGLAVTDIVRVSAPTVEGMASDLYPHADEATIRQVLEGLTEWSGALETMLVTEE